MQGKYLSEFFKNSRSITLSFILVLTIFSCQKEDETAAVPTQNLEPLIKYLESTGFKREDIVFKNNEFIIDDDIVISKEEVENYMASNENTTSMPNGKVEHYRGYLVSNTYVTNVKYFIESGVSEQWRTAIRGAINQWNAINGTKLYLSEVFSATSANTRINTAYSSENWVARAYLPSSTGRPGHLLTINTKYNTMDSGRKLFTIVHEMGHNVGFYHTNQTQGTFIQGTPTSDPNSVMNSFVLPWNGFTAGDIKAVQIIYPQ